uniref:G-protein coupled receptors family 3 profile domain-containing protein n=1 Tax=Salvator merianae TaxID=96440 RepID=A0A8D0B4U9_SALMN
CNLESCTCSRMMHFLKHAFFSFPCSLPFSAYRFNFRGYRWVKAMIHAINDINKRDDLLPDIKLGYQIYDTCFTMSKTVENSLSFLTGQNETTPKPIVYRTVIFIPILYFFSFVQSQGMAFLVHHFGWKWIGTIAADDDYGKYGVKAFKEKVEDPYTCIAFSETIPKIYSREKIQAVVKIVKETNATVIVVYSSDIDFHPLVEELMINNITGKTWIASEAWVTSALIARPEYFPLLGGAIGFGVRRGEIPDFSSDVLCTGNESLEELNNTYLDVSELRITYNVYKAVYAVAYGLEQLRLCEEEGRGPFIPDYDQLSELSTNLWGKKMVTISAPSDFQRPRSTCNNNCQPGFRKGILQGKPSCCYDCIKCAEGQISNSTDARECTGCKEDYWSNEQRSECVLKEVEFLAYEDALGMTLIALSVFGSCVVLAVTGVYIKFRKTALVKANDRELSFLIQFSLVVTLMTSILFIGKPVDWSCQSRQTTLALGFSLCLSCVLGKTVMLFLTHLAKNSKVAEKARMSMKPIFQKIIVFNAVMAEVGICTAYLILNPPRMFKNTQFSIIRIIFECDEGSILYLCIMFGFDVFLAILCFLTAFVARKLPNNFNEAKFVTFGMLVFFIVWISFVPAYLSTRGKFKVAVEIFAILASSFGLLGCIFVPKCYIILLKPLRNTEEIVGGRAMTNDKSAPPTSASCTSEANTTEATVLED